MKRGMKRYYWLFLTWILCSPLISVGNSTDSSSAQLYIFRPKNYLGSATSINLSINGTSIGKIKNGEKLIFEMTSEGVIKIDGDASSPRSSASLKTEVRQGMKLYIRLAYRSAYTFNLILLKETDGASEFYRNDLYKGSGEALILNERDFPIRIFEDELETGTKKMDPTRMQSSGSGFFISSNGYIATNYHVIEDHSKLYVRNVYGDLSVKYEAVPVVVDEINDLAILKISDEKFQQINAIPYVLNPKLSDVGESVFALGYPLTGTMGMKVKLTDGIISSRTGFADNIVTYQISVPVQPGNSGGPLFSKNGELIGIISSIHRETDNVSYAIKSNFLVNLINLLPQTVLSTENKLAGKSLAEQVKEIENFVVLIENY